MSDLFSAVDRDLIAKALAAREHAHAVVTGYRVGAALLADDGRVFTGCNVEHIVLSLTCCAEQVAVMKAVSEGARRFVAIAVATDSTPPASPCGVCRQLLHGWKVPRVIMANVAGDTREATLAELLPLAFEL